MHWKYTKLLNWQYLLNSSHEAFTLLAHEKKVCCREGFNLALCGPKFPLLHSTWLDIKASVVTFICQLLCYRLQSVSICYKSTSCPWSIFVTGKGIVLSFTTKSNLCESSHLRAKLKWYSERKWKHTKIKRESETKFCVDRATGFCFKKFFSEFVENC